MTFSRYGGKMSVTDELLENNSRYAEGFDKGELPLPPAKGVAVMAYMDARLHVSKLLGSRRAMLTSCATRAA
jgi:carbonic anhydrase